MYKFTIEEVFKKVNSDINGLSNKEALKRLERDGDNTLPKKKDESFLHIFVKELEDPIVILLIITAVFSLLIGEVVDALVIFFIIIVDLLLGSIQEWKAGKSVSNLSNMIEVNTLVKRDGEEISIHSSNLVVGDIVFLASGDKISADMRIIECNNFTVDESVLTGESIAVNKNIGVIDKEVAISDMKNMVFAGTTVSTGRAICVVTGTGLNTEIGKIASKVATTKKEKSPLTIRMDKFSKQISIAIIIIAIVIAFILSFKNISFNEIFLSVVALSVSAMPEGLPLALTMALTITSNRIYKKHVIVKKLNSVESLGSCTYIASDKTGTLTINKQMAKKIVFPDGEEFDVDKDNVIDKNVRFISELGYINNEAIINKDKKYLGDSIDIAFKILGNKLDVDSSNINILKRIEYESEKQYSAVFYEKNGKNYCTVKGSLEKILSFCSTRLRRKIMSQNELLAKDGYRVIAIAYKEIENKKEYSERDLEYFTFVGLVAFIDPVRSDASSAIKECKKAGITTIMITGDHPLTAYAIAKKLGIASRKSEVCDTVLLNDELKKGEKQFDKFIKGKKVFTRMSPLDKLEIVNSLKRSGEFVAVTGDGVNDSPALKSANIGIAMGSGTDVSKDVSDMIILNDSFASIVDGVREGRGAYSNIRKISYMLLSCGFAEVLFFLLSILFNLPMPLVAIQLLWLNIVTDGLQDFALSFEGVEDDVMNKPPIKTNDTLFNKELFSEVFVSGLFIGVLVFLVWKYLLDSGMEVGVARGYVMALMVFIQNIHVLNCRSEDESFFKVHLKGNVLIPIVIVGSILLQVIVMESPILSKVLKTVSIPFMDCVFLFVISLSILVVVEIYKYFKRCLKYN
mgnify:FL=1